MFSRKSKPPREKKVSKNSGIDFDLGIPGFKQNQEEDDTELEAELLALTGGRKGKSDDVDFITGDEDEDLEAELARILGNVAGKKSAKTINPTGSDGSLRKLKNSIEILGSSEDMNDDDVDENDPDLLGELQMLTSDNSELVDKNDEEKEEEEPEKDEEEEVSQLDLIKSRLEMYKTAEAKAKANNESSRARRFNRGVKTLEKLLKTAQGGGIVPYSEIPPEIASNLKPAPLDISGQDGTVPDIPPPKIEANIFDNNPTEGEASRDVSGKDVSVPDIPPPDYDTKISDYNHNQGEAVEPKSIDEKRSGILPNLVDADPTHVVSEELDKKLVNKESPVLILITKRRDEFKIIALNAKKVGDLPTALENVKMVKVCDKLIASCHAGDEISESQIPPSPHETKKVKKITENVQKSGLSGVPIIVGEIFTTPKTIIEALNQRLNYYSKAMGKAESIGNRTEIRKNGDIVRVYQNAIRLHQSGRNIPFEKLPTPPGCPPIPIAFKI